jgi:hypothetical protein
MPEIEAGPPPPQPSPAGGQGVQCGYAPACRKQAGPMHTLLTPAVNQPMYS